MSAHPGDNQAAFKAQLDQMTQQLVAVERRAKTLAELNRLLSQGPDPLGLAQRAVDLVMRATGADGTFVYLWDPEVERLVLRVATEGHNRAHVGQIQLRLGEGVTGWSALMRQTVMLDDDIQRDPRFVGFAELDEDRFRSMIAVPIVVVGGDVLGVFSLYGTRPGCFSSHDVDLATEVGSLLASALIHAETVKDLRRQSAAARFLMTVPADATVSLQRCVDVLAELICEQVAAALCIVEVGDRSATGRLTRPGLAFGAEVGESVVKRGRMVRSRADLPCLVTELGPGYEKLTSSFGKLFPLGAITCYRARSFSEAEVSIVEALGAQASALVAVLSNPALSTPLAGRLALTPTPQQAERLLRDLGWRPGPTRPVLVRIGTEGYGSPWVFDRVVEAIREICGDQDHCVLAPSAPLLSILVPHRLDQWKRFEQTLRNTLRSLRSEAGKYIAAGIGPVAKDVTDLAAALRHAESALEWAELLAEPHAVVHYQDVAHLRLLPRAALDLGEELREALGHLDEIIRYDLRHGTDLSQTLDAYFANRCSVTDTANALFIHRNTLRQRLGRIEELSGRSADEPGDWIVAALAARLAVASQSQLTKAQARTASRACPHENVIVGSGCCGMPDGCVLTPPAP
jgi:putative methionine-R-sulfoxide reductase with GAF domain